MTSFGTSIARSALERVVTRCGAILVACFLLGAPPASAQGYVVTTTPDSPVAGEAFQVSITGSFPALYFIDPTVDVSASAVTVHLNGDCGFLCPGPVQRTFTFSLTLGAGAYDLTVFPDGPMAGLSGQAHVTIGNPPNYQGLWWNAPAGSESGWGLDIAHQGDTLFATWFTYDTDGSATWLVVPGAVKGDTGAYSGPIYRASRTPSSDGTFQLDASTTASQVGTASFSFTDPDNGAFAYVVDGVSQTKPIARQVFALPKTTCFAASRMSVSNYQDLWWEYPAGSKSGWGMSVAQQGGIVFAVLYGYDARGRASWVVMPDLQKDSSGAFAGDVYRTTGPAFSASPWLPSQVGVARVGRGALLFPDAMTGFLTLAFDGSATVQKTMTRQVFSNPPTLCQ